MSSILLIGVGLSIFFAMLKLTDFIRDIAFEIREARRAMEFNAASTKDFQKECWQTLKTQSDHHATQSSLEEFLGETANTDSRNAPEAAIG